LSVEFHNEFINCLNVGIDIGASADDRPVATIDQLSCRAESDLLAAGVLAKVDEGLYAKRCASIELARKLTAKKAQHLLIAQ
jgi:hypothetical protein